MEKRLTFKKLYGAARETRTPWNIVFWPVTTTFFQE